MYIFRTGPNGSDQTEGIKFGPPDRAIIFFGRGSDLENFYLNKFLLDNSKQFVTMEATLLARDIPTYYRKFMSATVTRQEILFNGVLYQRI